MPPTPTPTIPPVSGTQVPTILGGLEPWMIFAIVVIAFIALMASLWMVYNYINNIRTTAIHHTMLRDAVFKSRYAELNKQILSSVPYFNGTDLWGTSAEELEQQRAQAINEIAELEHSLDNLRSSTESEDSVKQKDLEWRISVLKRNLEIELSEAKIKERREAGAARENKRKEEEERYEKDKKNREAEITQQANREADILVPPTLTVAGMGITGSFFIELTAILTIIFGIIILGLVGILATDQIAPILAAIAGYVLGKTTSGWAPYGQSLSTPPPQSQPQSQISSSQPGSEQPPQQS